MRRTCNGILALALTAGLVFSAASPANGATGQNGRIVYGLFDQSAGDFRIFTANADGTDAVQLLPGLAECPTWSPDGTRILVCDFNADFLLRPATVSPDGSGFTLLDNPDPSLNIACWAWASSGTRLACESWDDVHPERQGIYTVRAADGADLQRVTSGHDAIADTSPDGNEIVFLRNSDPLADSAESGALFVVKLDGTGLRRITPWNFANSASWSPDGRWIAFSRSSGGNVFLVHPDGSGLHQLELELGAGRSFAHDPVWAPDGSRLLMRVRLRSEGYQSDLFTVAADGTDLRRVTDTPDNEEFGDWGTYLP